MEISYIEASYTLLTKRELIFVKNLIASTINLDERFKKDYIGFPSTLVLVLF